MTEGGPSIPAPVQEEIRRFSVGTLVSRGFSVWLSKLPLFFGISLICHLPLLLFFPGHADRQTIRWLNLARSVVDPLLSAVVSGAIIRAVFEQLRGGRASLRDSLQVAFRGFWRIVWTTFAVGIMVVLFGLLLIVPGIMKACSYFVAVPVAVVEGTGPSESLRRSASLTEGYRWHVFAFYLLMWVVSMVIIGILAALALDPQNIRTFARSPGMTGIFVLSVLPNAFVGSVTAVFSGVAYYQLRVVKEGIDIEQLAAVFD